MHISARLKAYTVCYPRRGGQARAFEQNNGKKTSIGKFLDGRVVLMPIPDPCDGSRALGTVDRRP